MRFLGATKMDFIGKRRIAIGGSLLLIVVGLVAVGVRGREIFDIDFNGGTSVTMVLQESKSPDDVRSTLNDYFQENFKDRTINCTVNTVGVEDREPNTVYKIDTNIEDVRDLEEAIKQAFRDPSGKKEWLAYDMSFDGVKEQQVSLDEVMAPAAKTPAARNQLQTPPRWRTPCRPRSPRMVPMRPKKQAPLLGRQIHRPSPMPLSPGRKSNQPLPSRTPNQVSRNRPRANRPRANAAKSEPAKSEPAKSEPTKSEPAKSESDGATSRRRDLPSDKLVAWNGPLLTALQEEPGGDQQEPAAKQPADSQAEATAAHGAKQARGRGGRSGRGR